ncbi:MAG: hypothetical protein U0457_13540 [Candidatus Sericytochromatia bacterium]
MEIKQKTSELIKKMAEIAWENHIKGSSLERNSLLEAINKIFEQLRKSNQISDIELIRVSTIQKIFDYLDRINDSKYDIGKTKILKITELVDIFFKDILEKNYNSKIQLILSDEKNLKAAYLFYIRNCIPNKEKGE